MIGPKSAHSAFFCGKSGLPQCILAKNIFLQFEWTKSARALRKTQLPYFSRSSVPWFSFMADLEANSLHCLLTLVTSVNVHFRNFCLGESFRKLPVLCCFAFTNKVSYKGGYAYRHSLSHRACYFYETVLLSQRNNPGLDSNTRIPLFLKHR